MEFQYLFPKSFENGQNVSLLPKRGGCAEGSAAYDSGFFGETLTYFTLPKQEIPTASRFMSDQIEMKI